MKHIKPISEPCLRQSLAHGGVLDRFDSVVFVAPVLAALLPLLL